MNIFIVVGTRPEVIKMAPVIAALVSVAKVTVCTTGQHREMLAQALSIFSLKPDVVLDTMTPGQSLNILASRQLELLDAVLASHKPDWVLVQGDTTTALCASLAAFHRGIKIGHVEAGLRTGDLESPFPEEANRNLIARIANLHFAPTESAAAALRTEGIPSEKIKVTGNTVVDAIELMKPRLTCESTIESCSGLFDERLPLVLVTCHRRENFGSVLENICAMLARLCQRYTDHQWLFPVHLNPNVREPVMRILGNIPNLKLIDPVDYVTSLFLISKACLVLSDSGGIQEEAPSFGTPVVVMREHTERREGIDAGFATLAGQEPQIIEDAVHQWLSDPAARRHLQALPNPYGDGHAAGRIAASLIHNPTPSFDD